VEEIPSVAASALKVPRPCVCEHFAMAPQSVSATQALPTSPGPGALTLPAAGVLFTLVVGVVGVVAPPLLLLSSPQAIATIVAPAARSIHRELIALLAIVEVLQVVEPKVATYTAGTRFAIDAAPASGVTREPIGSIGHNEGAKLHIGWT
jgi:hypothetical protein